MMVELKLPTVVDIHQVAVEEQEPQVKIIKEVGKQDMVEQV